MIERVAAARVLADVITPAFLESLTLEERLVFPYLHDLWLRPAQHLPDYPWRIWTNQTGRGWGKTLSVGCWMIKRAQAGVGVGTNVGFALVGKDEDRIEEIQIDELIALAPPWFPFIRYRLGGYFPTKAVVRGYSAESPEAIRGANLHAAWCEEIIAWPAGTAWDTWTILLTACRRGPHGGQIATCTTAKPGNQILHYLAARNAEDPHTYPITRGTMFDNPHLPRLYIRNQATLYPAGTRGFDEEVRGVTRDESSGALWTLAEIELHRHRGDWPQFAMRLVAIDPAKSARPDADETGILIGGATANGHLYPTDDRSGRYTPDQWAEIAVSACLSDGCAGIVVERTGSGDQPATILRAAIRARGAVPVDVPADSPFPNRESGKVFLKEVHARESKIGRAGGPAQLASQGLVHHCGTFPKLELELITFEPGVTKSPNRFDAYVWLLQELSGIARAAVAPPPPPPTAAAIGQLRKRLRFETNGRVF